MVYLCIPVSPVLRVPMRALNWLITTRMLTFDVPSLLVDHKLKSPTLYFKQFWQQKQRKLQMKISLLYKITH